MFSWNRGIQQITPFEFLDQFPAGKKVAFIGNSPRLLEHANGEVIDNYDVVVRFNECRMTGFEKQLGTKTTILVTNPYAENRNGLALEGRTAELVVCIFQQTRRAELASFNRWLGSNRKVMFSYCPDLVGVEGNQHVASCTTGTYGIQLLWRILRPSEIFVTGFSMFDQIDKSHYWTDQVSEGLRAHDTTIEAGIFVRLLNSIKCPVKVTPEVLEICRRGETDFRAHVTAL